MAGSGLPGAVAAAQHVSLGLPPARGADLAEALVAGTAARPGLDPAVARAHVDAWTRGRPDLLGRLGWRTTTNAARRALPGAREALDLGEAVCHAALDELAAARSRRDPHDEWARRRAERLEDAARAAELAADALAGKAGRSPGPFGHPAFRSRDALAILAADHTAVELAGIFHVTPAHARSTLRSHGLQARPDVLDNPHLLVRLYLDEGLSLPALAARLDRPQGAVVAALSRHRIPLRPRGGERGRTRFSQLHDRQWLRARHVDEGRTITSIAEELGCSQRHVRTALIRAGLRTGALPDGTTIRPRGHASPGPELRGRDESYRLLAEWVDAHGRLPRRRGAPPDEARLANFCAVRRRDRRAGSLPADQAAFLERLGDGTLWHW